MRFPPLIRCDGPGCGALVEPDVGRCGSHRAKLGPLTDARPGAGKHAAPDEAMAHCNAHRAPRPENPVLVPCVGPSGAGCPDDARIERRGRRKRCQACERRRERERAKRSQPTRPMAFHLWQAARRREVERERAERR